MSAEPRDIIGQSVGAHRYSMADSPVHRCVCGTDIGRNPGALDAHRADAVLAALRTGGWLFTAEDARLMRLAIDWIASELRDQEIPPSEYVGTRTFLNEMITRFDTYAALVGSDTPWAHGEAQR